jgi:hypothetical protein
MDIQDSLFNITDHQTTSDDHYTPKWIFDVLNVQFDIDVASPPGGIPYINAKKYYTQADDGLTADWQGLVWCNPPYSNVGPWIDRLNNHKNGIALLPYVKSPWRNKVWAGADGIMEPSDVYSIKFMHRGKEKEIMFPTYFAGWGAVALDAMSNLGRVRT